MDQGRTTISTIAEKTGTPNRLIRFWTDQKVLLPRAETSRAGRGNHREYPDWELYVAAILGNLAAAKIPIGPLRQVAMILRAPLMHIYGRTAQIIGDEGIPGVEEMRAAIAGIDQNILVLYLSESKPLRFRYVGGAVPVADALPEADRRNTTCVLVDLNAAFKGFELEGA